MSKLTKNQKIAYAKVEPEKAYKLTEAAALLKEITLRNLMLRWMLMCVWAWIRVRPTRW